MFYSPIIALFLLFEVIINCTVVTSLLEEGELCITESGKNGKCVLIANCTTALALIKKRGKPIICSFRGKIPIVCCEDVVSSTQSIAAEKCSEYKKLKTPIIEDSLRPNPKYTSIYIGYRTMPLEFPHMAILGYGNPYNPAWLCGGSLISENFVLTAAHCISTRYGNVSIVKLGVHRISELNRFVQLFTVKNTYQHPKFDPWQSYHDIALIELDHPADISSDIQPACLYTSKKLPSDCFTAIGWGATEYRYNSDILLKTNLRYVSYDKCASFYKGRVKFSNGLIDKYQICADGGGSRADTCQGDSGGPIHLPRDEYVRDSMYTIIGITSVGMKCGTVPAVYTRISHYVPWIESVVWPDTNEEENYPFDRLFY